MTQGKGRGLKGCKQEPPAVPDLVFGQSGIQVAEDGLQVDCDDAHCHVFSELHRPCQVLHADMATDVSMNETAPHKWTDLGIVSLSERKRRVNLSSL